MNVKLFTLLFFLFSASLHAQTIVDIVVDSPDHGTLEAAVGAAGLVETLSGDGPFTLFAPTDAAFAALGDETINALLADPSGALTRVLLQHVISGVADGSSIGSGITSANLGGDNLVITTDAGLQVNGINISVADIRATNGVVHVIDAVINQPMSVVDVVVGSEDHNTLEAAVVAAGLVDALASADFVTLFAPTDAAFAALGEETINTLLADPSGALTDILLYHAVGGAASPSGITSTTDLGTLNGENLTFAITGDGVQINDANVTVANIETANGIVHVIDAVLIPESVATSMTSVVDIIVNSPDHNTLETAVLAAGLETALSGPGRFTVFAPTDAAFEALDPATLEAALADPQGLLTTVLTYHVVNGTADTSNIFDGMRLPTLQGSAVTIGISDAGATVNNARITVTDIQAGNGVVHVIDAVLIP